MDTTKYVFIRRKMYYKKVFVYGLQYVLNFKFNLKFFMNNVLDFFLFAQIYNAYYPNIHSYFISSLFCKNTLDPSPVIIGLNFVLW